MRYTRETYEQVLNTCINVVTIYVHVLSDYNKKMQWPLQDRSKTIRINGVDFIKTTCNIENSLTT